MSRRQAWMGWQY